MLAQADRVPIASGAYEGGYVDITSDAGLDLVSKCSEINLNSAEEQNVIDRIGQEKPMTYIDILAEDTIDEKIVLALRKKVNIASEIMGEELKAWI